MKRESGYYWVKYCGVWIIGKYEEDFKDEYSWCLCGFRHRYNDEELEEIDEIPITRN